MISQGDQKPEDKRNQKFQGDSYFSSRKITTNQVTKSKPPRQGKIQVLIHISLLTDMTPQIRPFR